MLRSPKVIFSNLKVKEKDREYALCYRERSGGARLAKMRGAPKSGARKV